MPRWIERRGLTLKLLGSAQTPGLEQVEQVEAHGDQFVRLSLVERRGLVGGWFNVREARAEPPIPGRAPQVLAGGRALSWRWLRSGEAERLLDQRLRTLQTLGYTMIDAAVSGRGRWDWLYDLVRRGLQGASADDVDAAPPGHALRDALTRMGLSPDALIEGIGAVLKLSVQHLREPDAATVAKVDGDQLSVLLPFLVEHDSPQIQQIGERWLQSPPAAFQLPRVVVERWLRQPGRPGDLLASRVAEQGLALLGPDALLRLSEASCRPGVRQGARGWLRRLG